MYKIFLFALLLVFTGCNSKPSTPQVTTKNTQSNKKIFEEEDSLIMFALRAEQVKDYLSAASLFDTLYTKSKRIEYLHRSLQNYLFLKDNKKVITKVDEVLLTHTDDFILIRLKIIALIQDGKSDEALALAISLVEKSHDENDYILVSDIYVSNKQFDEAVKYLEGGYLQDYSEKILDKMSILLYVNLNKRKDAIAYLETHTRVHGCSSMICKRLISFYSNDDNMDGLLSAYLRYYRIDANQEVAKQIVQLYGYKKEYVKLILFLEDSKSDDKTLLELYISSKNYKKAFPLSKKLYDETGEIRYLGESVIFEYESQENKNDKAFLRTISSKFEELLEQDSTPLYLNYYGYILIDHNVDIGKGMKYVKRALEIEKDSSYYLDSLAWGYYKLGECKKALGIMNRVRTLDGGNDAEVVEHHNIIKKCKGKK